MDSVLSFGHWVQQRRKTLGLTQAELAVRIGCALVTLKKIEQDLRKPSRELSELLADHLAIATKDRAYFITAARGSGAPPDLPITQSDTPPADNAFHAAVMPTTTYFVTKERELQQLHSHLERALAGQSQTIFVTGEAGSGKSTLLTEFARRAQLRQRGLVVAGGSCNAFSGAGDPYLPFRDAMVMLLGELDGHWATRLAGVQPGLHQSMLPQVARALINYGPDVVDVLAPAHLLRQRANAAQPSAADPWPEQLRQLIIQQRTRATQPAPTQLFEQIRLVLETIASQQPLLLLLDDLQWADMASLNLLFHLGQRLADSPILLIGAFRPSEVNAWRGREEGAAEQHPLLLVHNELQRRFGEIEVSLDHGSPAEGRAFVDALLDAESNLLDNGFREELFNRTKGYPLFTIELLRAMQERGNLVPDDAGRWLVAVTLNWNDLPTRVEAVIEQRISRLPSLCQESLKVASVIGEEFVGEVVANVLQEQAPPVIHRLSNLLTQRYRLLASIGSRRLHTQRLSQYKFQHSLFQTYLYGTIDETERSYLHEAVGDTLEAIYGAEPELLATTAVQLAHHFQKADLPIKTVPYLLLAGKRAMQLSAYENAITHFEQGLTLLVQLPETAARDRMDLDLLVELGTALAIARGTGAEAVGSTFRRVLTLAKRSDDLEQQVLALFNLWRFYSDRADFAQCNEIADQLLDLAAQSDNPVVHLSADHALWTMSLYAGDFVRARHHAEQGMAWYHTDLHRALTAAHAGHDPGMCCRIFGAYALWYLGFPDQARQRSADAIDVARTVAHPFSLAMALTLAAEIQLLCRDPDAAHTYLQEGIALSQRHGFTSWLELGAIFQGWALAQAGQAEDGIERMLYGLEENRKMIGPDSGLHCIAQLAEAYGQAGRPADGLALLAKALDTDDKSKLRHWTQWQSEFYRLRGELRLLQHTTTTLTSTAATEIASIFQRAIAIAQEQQAKSPELRATMSLCRLWQRQGKQAEAVQALAAVYQWFGEGFATADLQQAKLLLEQLEEEQAQT